MAAQNDHQKAEWLRCAESPIYFLDRYGWIYDATAATWIPFKLWKEQARALKTMQNNRLTVILKARQLGITWLALGFALWLMIFHPAATVLVFSKRDTEAIYILGTERLRGMYDRLPEWMKVREVTSDNDHEWILSNGSVARAFPTSAGDSYTASLVIVDEADLAPDLGRMMNAVKPTIDGGGRMIMLSRSDNRKPESQFKKIYIAAKSGLTEWAAVFIPWYARPERDLAWYERQKSEIQERTGSLDDLHQQYPATDMEALSPASLAKRLPPEWLLKCYAELKPLANVMPTKAPAIPGLQIFRLPLPSHSYVIGADPAEGNPTSDDSSMHVLDAATGEEVANLAGKFQPSTFAANINSIGVYYRKACVLVERNNHGHAVLLWLRDNSKLTVLTGTDGRKGWHSTSVGKSLMYDTCADAFRDQDTKLHSSSTYHQLASIEGSTLRAPEGENDDRADSFALALLARTRPRTTRMGVA